MLDDGPDAVDHRAVSTNLRRWVPGALVLLLILTVLVTTEPVDGDDTTGVATGLPAAGNNPVPTVGGASPNPPIGGDTTPVAPGGTTPAPTAPGTTPDPQPGAAPAQPPPEGNGSGSPTTTAPGAGGSTVARSGADCSAAARQLPFSDYGPVCQPVFTDDNGGATFRGIDAETITVTFRVANSGSSAALEAAAGTALESLGANQDDVGDDMAVLVDFFNTQFELYGRQVDFKVFTGQGDVLEEYQNRGAQGAQADAARASDLGVFADVSIVSQTQLYAEALVANSIVTYSPVYLSEQWYQDRRGFGYSVAFPPGTRAGAHTGNIVCSRLSGGNATLSSDATFQAQPRVFGVLNPENPEFAAGADALIAQLAACGETVKRRVQYALDVTSATQQATNAIAQMRADGVTTILCLCDHTVPVFLTEAATQQRYFPEWVAGLPWPDPFPRLYSERQYEKALIAGGQRLRFQDLEPGVVFRMASGGVEPKAPLVTDWYYAQLLFLFSGFQAAGPNLNPTTLFQGIGSLPSTQSGALGPWEFSPGTITPQASLQLSRWDPNATSTLDGEQGGKVSCDGGAYYRFDQPGSHGPRGSALGCPGL